MLKHLYLVILSTFIMGFVTGIYVYFASQAPAKPQDEQKEEVRGFEIVADMYGGCDMLGVCPSYRILEGGIYTYIERERGGEDTRFEDTISERQVAELERLLRETNFKAIQDSEFTGTCPIAFDGSAYRYAINYEGERYEIDSCVERIEGEKLFDTLRDYFEIFRLVYDGV